MSEIRFYHLQSQPLERALPAILLKALEQGRRVIVRTPDAIEAGRLNENLWVSRPGAFIPHGTARDDGAPADQPVFLTPSDENPNGADVLILTGGAESALLDDFKLCCEMFDGGDKDAVKAARARWKTYESAGHDLTYWQQSEKGGWEEKTGQ